MTQRNEYTSLAKWLHWLVAALILVQYLLIELAERAEHANQVVKQLGIIANHKSIGITILLIAIIRLMYRFRHAAPELPSSMPTWQRRASDASHFLLYGFLFALPITGWLMSSASAYSVSWFNLVALPDFIAPDKHNAELLLLIHTRLSDALVVLAGLHVVAAVKHHVIDKDTVLVRILSKTSVTAAVVLLLVSVVFLGGFKTNKGPASRSPATQSEPALAPPVQLADSALAVWQIDYATSYVQFNGEQAGAPFTGRWQQWEGKLQFDETQLAASRFDVSIDITSVSSNDEERDQTILSADFFDVSMFPRARFQAQRFVAREAGFTASGNLTIKGISQPTDLLFNVIRTGDRVTLTGTAVLDRHAWDIGIGDWADPTWVGSEVTVKVRVDAVVSP